MKDLKVFRAITVYHLLQVLLLCDEDAINHLYIDEQCLGGFKDRLQSLGLFEKIIVCPQGFGGRLWLKLSRMCYSYLLFYLRFSSRKNVELFTPGHSMDLSVVKEFGFGVKVYILDEGIQSRSLYVSDGSENPTYFQKGGFMSWAFRNLLFNIYNPNVKKIYVSRFALFDSAVKTRIVSQNIDIDELDIAGEASKTDSPYVSRLLSVFDLSSLSLDRNNSYLLFVSQPIYLKCETDFENFMEKASQLLAADGHDKRVLFKPHPRDDLNRYEEFVRTYSMEILPQEIPLEVLVNYISVARVIGPQSTALDCLGETEVVIINYRD